MLVFLSFNLWFYEGLEAWKNHQNPSLRNLAGISRCFELVQFRHRDALNVNFLAVSRPAVSSLIPTGAVSIVASLPSPGLTAACSTSGRRLPSWSWTEKIMMLTLPPSWLKVPSKVVETSPEPSSTPGSFPGANSGDGFFMSAFLLAQRASNSCPSQRSGSFVTSRSDPAGASRAATSPVRGATNL